jgi:hypothetical protein
MITKANLPIGYVAYQRLTVCSNKILDGGFLLSIGEALPVVIGAGPQPQVWIQAPANPSASEFITIVEKSVAKHPLVRVVTRANGLSILVAATTLMEIESDGDGAAIVTKLDLRPMGIDVRGDYDELIAGGMHFKTSTFAGGGTVIGYGGR